MKSNASQWRKEHKNERLKSYHIKNKKFKNNSPVQGSSSNNTNNSDSLKPCYVPPNIPGNPQENSTLRGNAKKMHMRYKLFPISCVSCTCFCLFLMIFLLDLHYKGYLYQIKNSVVYVDKYFSFYTHVVTRRLFLVAKSYTYDYIVYSGCRFCLLPFLLRVRTPSWRVVSLNHNFVWDVLVLCESAIFCLWPHSNLIICLQTPNQTVWSVEGLW